MMSSIAGLEPASAKLLRNVSPGWGIQYSAISQSTFLFPAVTGQEIAPVVYPAFFAAWKMSSTWMASLNHSQLSSLLVVVKEKLLVTPCFPT